MRCFIAVDVDKDIKRQIKAVQSYLAGDIKPVAPENLHITLKFLGEIDENRVKKIEKTIENVCRRFEPFHIRLEKLGCFPNNHRPNVLWVGVKEKTLSEIIKTLDTELEKLGFEREANYTPHLTIARIKSGRHNVADILEKFGDKNFGKMTITKVILFKSKLTKSGPVYEKICCVKLA